MSKFTSLILLAAPLSLCLAAPSFAHPHKDDTAKQVDTKKDATKKDAKRVWPYFGDGADASKTNADTLETSPETIDAKTLSETIEQRLSKHTDRLDAAVERAETRMKARSGDMDNLTDAATALEAALAESGILSSLAAMVTDLAEDVDIADSDKGKMLRFDGKDVLYFKHDKERNDSLSIGGLGQNMTIDRETYIKDGKTKTRIVIEMDGGEDIDIDLPNASPDPR
ncbi:hypothetical protein ACJ3XI_11360 [Litorimonas sp. RW-G-Af-16]|uniref:hypothetical protein n=1 Tax=Litorimonas sp. RW-G-Af-16 TaxID=3241168 RepID=UPI00390C6207